MIFNRKIIRPAFTLVISLFFVLFSQTIVAQEYDIRTIPIINKEGSALIANSLFKDSSGFLWYSTQQALVRKMGSHATVYSYNHPTKSSIPFLPKLLETQSGIIIGATDYGVFSLNPITGKIDWILTPTLPETDRLVHFYSPWEDAKGTIWMGSEDGYLYSYSSDKKIMRYKASVSFDVHPDESSDSFLDLLSGKYSVTIMDILDDGSIIIKQNEVWYRFFNGELEFIMDANQPNKAKHDESLSEISDNGEYFKKNSSGNYRLEDKKYNYTYIPIIDRQIFQFPYLEIKKLAASISENGVNTTRIVARSKTKLKIFEIDTEEFRIKKEFDLENEITNFIVDSDNAIWINTVDGITRIHPIRKPFKPALFNEKGLDIKENISCRGLAKTSNGNIYIYTHNGWFVLKKGHNSFEKIEFIHEKTAKSLSNGFYSFYKQNDSVFWAYGYSHEIYKLNVAKKTYAILNRPAEVMTKNNVAYDIEPLDKETLLIAGSFGLFEFNLNTHQFKRANQLSDTTNVLNKDIFDVYFDRRKNELWLGMYDNYGLYKKNLTTGALTHFYKGNNATPLVNNFVSVIYPEGEDILWIGTDNGLQKINTETLETKIYTVDNGFKDTRITGIIEEGDYLWIGTYNGLVRLHKKTEVINVYFEKDGLPDNEFNKKSFFKASCDTLFFGGINGLVGFNPKNIEHKNEKNSLFLVEANFYDEKLEYDFTQSNNLQNLDSFRLLYNHNYLNLKFSVNDILYPEKNTYKYRIKGLGDNWTSLGNHDELQLLGITPGTYEIEIQGYNSIGTPTNILKYNLLVEQIFYKELWFVVLTIMILVGFTLSWHFYRKSILKSKYEQQHKFTLLETKALRAQMNPHFIFNALNSIQSVMILKGEKEANTYLVSFSKLLRHTLDMSNSEYISLKDEIDYLKSYLALENLRLNRDLNYYFDVPDYTDTKEIYIPCMLFQPVVENAIVHGLALKKKDKKLYVSMTIKDDMLIGEITDNGIGRDAAQRRKENDKPNHKSWATHVMNERINISNSLYQKKISFNIIDLEQDGKPLGTKVILSIPIKMTELL